MKITFDEKTVASVIYNTVTIYNFKCPVFEINFTSDGFSINNLPYTTGSSQSPYTGVGFLIDSYKEDLDFVDPKRNVEFTPETDEENDMFKRIRNNGAYDKRMVLFTSGLDSFDSLTVMWIPVLISGETFLKGELYLNNNHSISEEKPHENGSQL